MSNQPPHTPVLVRDLMTVGVPTCPADTPLPDVVRLMLERDLEGLVVLDIEGHAVGVITQDEVVRVYARPDAHTLTAEQFMRADVPEVPPDIPLTAAAQIMQDMGVRIFFLMHNAGGITWPAAIITYRHLMRHLAAESPEELKDLGIRAAREAPLDIFKRRMEAARRQNGDPSQE